MKKNLFIPLSLALLLLASCGETSSESLFFSSEESSSEEVVSSSSDESSLSSIESSSEESSSELSSSSSSVEPNNFTYFGVLSDIHLQTEDLTSESYFRNAIERFKFEAEKDGGKLSGVIIAGDLCDSTWYQCLQYEDVTYYNDKEHRDVQLNYIGNVFNSSIPEDVPLLYCLGNHDNSSDMYDQSSTLGYAVLCGESSRRYRNIFETIRPEFFAFDDEVDHSGLKLSKNEMIDKGLRLAHVNNTHVVMINNNTYYHVTQSYTKESLDWLDGTLKFLNRMYPQDPIFVVTHNPVSDSTLGAIDDNSTVDLQPILSKYPNTLTLSGHVHYDNYSEYALDGNGGYLTLDTTCCKMANATHYADKNHLGKDDKVDYDVQYSNLNTNSSEGNLLIINEEGETTIKRLDFLCKSYSGPDWVIPAPGDESRISKFSTEERLKTHKAPVFTKSATVEVERDDDYLNITWPKATTFDLPVYAYRVYQYDGEDHLIDNLIVSSPKNVREDVPYFYVTLKDKDHNIKKIRVVAENSLYQQSDAIGVDEINFTSPSAVTYPSSRVGETISSLGNIKYGDYNLYRSTQFNISEGSVDNYKTAHAKGSIFFDAIDTNYSFSYRISKARCNKGDTSYGNSQADYAIGACLATFVYKGRQISLCASLCFSLGGTQRTPFNKISYRYLITTPGGSTWSYNKELSSLNVDLTNPADLKATLESDQGGTLKVTREGSNFSLYLDNTLLDSKDLAGEYFYHNTLTKFDSSTPSSFGIFTYGGEATFDNFDVNVGK